MKLSAAPCSTSTLALTLPGVAGVAGHLTPMPGGTGPMTVVMVIANTIVAARRRRGA